MRCRGAAALLAVGLLAAGCASGGRADGGPLQLVLFGDPVETRGYAAMVEQFEATGELDVQLAPVATQDDLLARLTTSFAAGSPPEVFLVNSRSYARFAEQGALANVQPFLDASQVLSEDDFYPTAFDAFRNADGDLVCMPQNLSSLQVYYNADLFAAAGLEPPRPGWTSDDFLATAQALTRNGTYGVGTEASLMRLAPFVWSSGGEVVDDADDPTRLTLSDGPSRAAVDFFLDLQLRHGVAPPEREERSEDAETRFLRGGLGMYLDSRRAVPSLRTIEGFRWDVGPLPVAPGGTPSTVLHSDAYCLSREGDPAAGWRLIEFAMSEQGQTTLAASGRTVPSRRDVAQSPAFLDPEQPPASSQVFLDAAEVIRALPVVPTWTRVEKEGDEILDAVYYGRVDREEGLRRLEETAADLLRGDG